MRALEEAGLIQGYTALIDEAMLGHRLTAFAIVRKHNQAKSGHAPSKIAFSAGL